MEKLNIVWIKKWKIKRNLISVMTKINNVINLKAEDIYS